MEAQKPDEHLPSAIHTVKRTRRRGREVCSRYMIPPSPSTSSSSLRNHFHNQKPRISSVPSSPDASDSESEPSSSYADENQHCFLTPLPLGAQAKAPNTQKRRAIRLFSDNAGDTPQTHFVEHHKVRPPNRVGTPRTALCSQTQQRSTKKTANHGAKPKASILFPNPVDSSLDSGSESCSISGLGGLCDSPPIRAHGSCRARQASELRSSMPEADLLPTTSRKPTGVEELMLRHSFNSICRTNHLDLMKTVSTKSSVHGMCDLGRVLLPPQPPPSNRLGLGLKKGKKELSRKEDVHVLHLLHNQYLQWRFVNAVAKSATKARSETAERSLSEVNKNLEELRCLVIEKRMELEKLLRLRRLFSVVDVEMPYLEEWALADREYSDSLSGTINALKDASVRLPVTEDVRVDIRELEESIHFATSMFDSFSPSIERFLPKADGVSKEMSELAIVASREKALIDECGGLLSEVQILQAKECSLSSMLMQVKRSSIV